MKGGVQANLQGTERHGKHLSGLCLGELLTEMEVDDLSFLFRKSGDFFPQAALLLCVGSCFEGRGEWTGLDLPPRFANGLGLLR